MFVHYIFIVNKVVRNTKMLHQSYCCKQSIIKLWHELENLRKLEWCGFLLVHMSFNRWVLFSFTSYTQGYVLSSKQRMEKAHIIVIMCRLFHLVLRMIKIIIIWREICTDHHLMRNIIKKKITFLHRKSIVIRSVFFFKFFFIIYLCICLLH